MQNNSQATDNGFAKVLADKEGKLEYAK